MLTRWLIEKDGKRFQIDIPTPDSDFERLPKMSFNKRNEFNRLLREIEKQYKNNVIYFILIRKRDCTFCQQSMPYWLTIVDELGKRIPQFYTDIVDYDRATQLKTKKDGVYQIVTGKDVIAATKPRGVPAVLSNGKGSYGRFKTFPKMRVVWDMVIQPFPFLREVFGVQ